MKAPANTWLYFVAAITWLLATGSSTSLGVTEQHLRVPDGLRPAVVFWEKVFSEYSPDECVFHDKDDLSVIYMAKYVPKDSPASSRRLIKKYRSEIRVALLNLSEGYQPRTNTERLVLKAFPASQRKPQVYALAADNIRCQRGVDLRPSLVRSQQHLKMVKRVLLREGLPTDLAYLPHLESGYNVLAHSKAGARGIWQLMPATARAKGLKVSRFRDARVDPFLSTKAAAQLLSDLKRRTGSWPLAITAYNYGPNGMARAIKKLGPDYMVIRAKHQTRIFGFASRNYYPSFLAARNVARRLEQGEKISGMSLASKKAARKAAKEDIEVADIDTDMPDTNMSDANALVFDSIDSDVTSDASPLLSSSESVVENTAIDGDAGRIDGDIDADFGGDADILETSRYSSRGRLSF